MNKFCFILNTFVFTTCFNADAMDAFSKAMLLGNAVQSNNVAAIKKLAKEGVDLSIGSEANSFCNAARLGKTEIVKILLEENALKMKDNTQINKALIYASHFGQTGVIRMLLEHGADVDAKIRKWLDFTSPLYWAVNQSSEANVRLLLLEYNADPDMAETSYGITPSKIANSICSKPILNLFQEYRSRAQKMHLSKHAFCAALHNRCGLNSPAKVLGQHATQEIFRRIKPSDFSTHKL